MARPDTTPGLDHTILALGLYPSSGGPSKSVRAFQRALSADVISWVDPVRIEQEPQVWGNIPCHLVRGSRLPMLRQLLYPASDGLQHAEAMIAHSRLVSCHSFLRWHNIWLEQMATRHSVPYWFVPHGVLDPYVFSTKSFAKQLFMTAGGRRFLDRASGVVCATRREHEKLEPLMPSTPHAVIPWPLDDSEFRQRDEASRLAMRRELRIGEDQMLLISLGRLHPMKRPLETVRAVADAGRNDVRLVIIGNEDGVSMAECVAAAARLGIQEHVHVVGPAFGARKSALLDAADAYVSLSHRENFNFTCAEAMAAGLPVILSRGNDLAADIREEQCGWMLADDADAPSAIAACAAMSPAAREAIGERGRAWASRNLRFDDFATRIRRFAAQVAGPR